MISGGTYTDVEDIRRRFRLVAVMSLSGDLVVIAALWLVGALPQDLLVIITAFLIAGGTMSSYLIVKVLPDWIVKQRGLAAIERARKE